LPRNIHESVNPARFQQGPEQKTRHKIDADFYSEALTYPIQSNVKLNGSLFTRKFHYTGHNDETYEAEKKNKTM
jgi:hypothetical protein